MPEKNVTLTQVMVATNFNSGDDIAVERMLILVFILSGSQDNNWKDKS